MALTTSAIALSLLGGAASYGSMYAYNKMTNRSTSASSFGKQRGIDDLQTKALTTPSIDTASAVARKRLEDKRRGIARNKSIFTTPLGIQEGANITQKRLLGQ